MMNTLNSLIVAICIAGLFNGAGCSERSKEDAADRSNTVEKEASEKTDIRAVIETERGTFTIMLRPDLAPQSTANFVNLAQRGFYHGREVVGSNMGSASFGQGKATPLYKIKNEYSPDLIFDKPGIVAWTFVDTKAGTTNQIPHPTRFFVTKAAKEEWTFQYCPFGEVIDGQDVVNRSQRGDWIKSVRIVGDWQPFMEQHAAMVENWNTALRLAGEFAPGEQDATLGGSAPPTINSN